MVLEAVGPPGQGALGFALGFVEETLASTESKTRPWAIVEIPENEQLYVPAFSPGLRAALADGRLLWVRASAPKLAEVTQILLESALCAGVFVNGLELKAARDNSSAWMRRWQLAAEKSSAHLLWVHGESCDVVGFNVRVAWTGEGVWNIKKGHGLIAGSPFKSLRALGTAARQEASHEKKTRPQSPHPETTRVA